MKRCAILVLFCATTASQASLVISESTNINDGDVCGPLEVRDGTQGQTTVRMNGGSVEDILALDSSRVEVAGGNLFALTLGDQSSASLQGGQLTIAGLRNAARLEMSAGGLFLVFGLTDDARAHVAGGVVQATVGVGGKGQLDIDGGQWDSFVHAADDGVLTLRSFQTGTSMTLWATDRSRVSLLASSTQYDTFSLALGGTWLDGRPFSIQLHDAETSSHVTIVPEPLTLALFAAAALGYRRHSLRVLFASAGEGTGGTCKL